MPDPHESQSGALACDHAESLYGRCAACGMTWKQQAERSDSSYPTVTVVDARENGTTVPCTWAEDVALRAAENLGIEVGPNDHAALALDEIGLRDDDALIPGRTYELVIIGGTV